MFVPEEEAGEVREENSSEPIAESLNEPVTETDIPSDPQLETEIQNESAVEAEIQDSPVREAEAEAAAGSGETPGTGESPYNRDDYREQVYADAHYEPAGESTVPPRYYCPPERPVKETKEKKPGKTGRFLRVACLALVCALLGGFLGSALTAGKLNDRIDALENRLCENETAVTEVSDRQNILSASPVISTVSGESGALSGAQIYEQACRQVVGITTDVTFTNYFGMQSSSAVSGSGFIISEDGYIVTNFHVIEYAVQQNSPITVMLHDGTKYTATIVGTEQANDIAVLKIEATGLTPAVFGNSESLHVGDTVYAVGNPLGELEFSMSTGHVSALDRVITTEDSESINMFQIDAAVNPGNSGGPVYNSLGQVVGVVTAKYSSSGVEGLGFAIPVNDVNKITDDLITKGYVTGKAYLGIWLDERYSEMYAQYYNMPLGAYVADVGAGTCAEKAGIQKGDVITKLGGIEIASYSELKTAMKQFYAGDQVEIELYRAGESVTLTVTLDEAKPEAA